MDAWRAGFGFAARARGGAQGGWGGQDLLRRGNGRCTLCRVGRLVDSIRDAASRGPRGKCADTGQAANGERRAASGERRGPARQRGFYRRFRVLCFCCGRAWGRGAERDETCGPEQAGAWRAGRRRGGSIEAVVRDTLDA